jgi:V-type H+-transporting ATPase subunit A
MSKRTAIEELGDKESEVGRVYKVAGPLVVAEAMIGAKMYELVKVGWDGLIGEIIKLEGELASIQCYEDTYGLTVGDPVYRTKQPLSVTLGPGIMEQIFDGIQRPLNVIFNESQDVFLKRGVDVPALDLKKPWEFQPATGVRDGQLVVGGDIVGWVYENELFDRHAILVPPRSKGKITYLAPAGNYSL